MVGLLAILFFSAVFLAIWGLFLFSSGEKIQQAEQVADRLKMLSPQNPPDSLDIRRLSHDTFLHRLLESAGVRFSVAKLITISFSFAVFGFIVCLVLTKNILLCLCAAVVAAFIPLLYVLQLRKKRLNTFTNQFPDAISMMASCLRAGHGLSAAMEAVANEMAKPVSEEFKRMLAEINLGSTTRQALIRMEERITNKDVCFFSAAVLLQKEVGGSLAEVFNNLEESIRERFELKGELKAMTAQQRLTGIILGFLPIGVGSIIFLLNPSYFSTLFEDPWGQALIIAGVVCQILGFLAIKKIVSIDYD